MASSKSVATRRMANDELYRDQQARIVRLCRLLLADRDEASDVAQEVFEKLLRERARSSATISWEPWLRRVAVNACRDRRRSAWWRYWRAAPSAIDETTIPETLPTPEERLLGTDFRRAVWGELRRLPVRQREVFVLRILEDCSTDETAEALGVTAGSVKRHLFRAVGRLRSALRGAS